MRAVSGEWRSSLFANSEWNICDTQYCSRSGGFSAFCDAVSNAFMPWQIEYKEDKEFEARMVCATSETGAIARVGTSPVIATRKSAEIAKSAGDCLYANYVISGELRVEQQGRTTIAKRGDIVLYDSALPVRIIETSAGLYEDLAIRNTEGKVGSG